MEDLIKLQRQLRDNTSQTVVALQNDAKVYVKRAEQEIKNKIVSDPNQLKYETYIMGGYLEFELLSEYIQAEIKSSKSQLVCVYTRGMNVGTHLVSEQDAHNLRKDRLYFVLKIPK